MPGSRLMWPPSARICTPISSTSTRVAWRSRLAGTLGAQSHFDQGDGREQAGLAAEPLPQRALQEGGLPAEAAHELTVEGSIRAHRG